MSTAYAPIVLTPNPPNGPIPTNSVVPVDTPLIIDPGKAIIAAPAVRISEPVSRWHQDIEVHEFINHLNQPDKYDNWENLTPSEIRGILRELDRCRKDFVYAARNYFWITDKKRREMLFALWPGQELILQKVLDIRAKKKPQKILIIKGRQLGALDPETPVLTADMRWKRIDDLNPGDELLGVDEFPPGGRGASRLFRYAKVLNKWGVVKEAYRITLNNGKTIIATGDHPFLCRRRGGDEAVWITVKKQGIKKSMAPLVPGDKIRQVFEVWPDERSYEDGWFGGLLDGEGCLQAKKNAGVEIGIAQVAGDVLNRAASYLSSRGYNYRTEVDSRKSGSTSKLGNKPVFKFEIGRAPEVARLLGVTRPARFIGRRPFEGKDLPKSGNTESWATIVDIDPLGRRRMVDIETTTKTFIANGLVTHNCSTLIEALIAWRTMFFSGVNALVVSYDQQHTADVLFPIMCFILDRMPWWLKPMVSNRKADEGIFFENKDYKLRGTHPGLNSKIYVKGANSTTGVGQGMKLSAVHASEIADYDDATAKEIINEDMKNAIAEDDPDAFAIMETTAKGSNRFIHKLWKRNVYLAATGKEEWYPLFLPAFFEAARVRSIAPGWEVQPQELKMRERIIEEWVRCDHEACKQYHVRSVKGHGDKDGTVCPTCKVGTLHKFLITDEQLAWFEHRRENATDEEDKKTFRQEMCLTPQDAFQLFAMAIFPDKAQEFAASQVRPPIAWGDYDRAGNFHGCDERRKDHKAKYGYYPCFTQDCRLNHTLDDAPCLIWEWPNPEEKYCCGADIAEGLGGNYSVGVVLKISTTGGKDYQVATWRSNTINVTEFTRQLNWLGRHYNDAMMSPECNRFDTVVYQLRMNFGYPNIYRWKHLDSINTNSSKLGWLTTMNSRPRLYTTFRTWLMQEQIIVRSANLVEEIPNFSKQDEDDTIARADQGENDDELIAAMIALYCAHEDDYSESMGCVLPRDKMTLENSIYRIKCNKCGHEWPADEVPTSGPAEFNNPVKCPMCKSLAIGIQKNFTPVIPQSESLYDTLDSNNAGWSPGSEWAEYGKKTPEYWML